MFSIDTKQGEKAAIEANFCVLTLITQNSLSSTSGRVNNSRHFVSGSRDGIGNRRSGIDDVGPGLGLQSVLWAERERNSVNGTRDSILHLRPRFLVELSNENHLGFGMLQNVFGCFGSEGRVNLW